MPSLRRSCSLVVMAGAALLAACRSPQSSQPPEPSVIATSTAAHGAHATEAVPSSASSAAAPPSVDALAPPSAAASAATRAPAGERAWSFDSDQVSGPPPGFTFGRTGGGSVGRWVVLADPSAPSAPNVLAQLDADTTDYRFPVAVANEPELRDLRLSVRCKQASGKVDQACGLVFRYRDENNYYVTRANALEGNVRLYYVKDGQREQIASYRGEVKGGTWHEYRIEARRDHFEVYWNGSKVIDQKDTTFTGPGKVGVWTKADSVTYFDDLSVTPF